MTLPASATESDGTVTELGPTGAELFAEMARAQQEKAAAEERLDLIKSAIQSLMGDSTAASVGGQVMATWKPVTSRRFDQQTAQRFLSPEQWAACYVETESRRFVPTRRSA